MEEDKKGYSLNDLTVASGKVVDLVTMGMVTSEELALYSIMQLALVYADNKKKFTDFSTSVIKLGKDLIKLKKQEVKKK